jgi:glycosyltransferase involved in cell wall biosynthesis
MNILVVVTAFYPELAIGSIRLTKFAKYLKKQGHDLTIISLSPPDWGVIDNSLYFSELEEINWIQLPQSKIFKKTFAKGRNYTVGNKPGLSLFSHINSTNPSVMRDLKRLLIDKVQFLFTLIKALDWLFVIYFFANKNLIDKKFDLILTSYPSLASPMAGVMLKKMCFAKFLIVDFRDAVSYRGLKNISIRRFFEKYFLSQSDLSVYVSDGIRSRVSSGNHSKNYLVLSNGFDINDLGRVQSDSPAHPTSALKFCYVGGLYGGKRSLEPFFKLISELCVSFHLSLRDIEIHYAGFDSVVFRSQAEKYLISHLIIDHGQISRNASLILQGSSDICLVATWNDFEEEGILTGKLFEYFLQHKVILAIVGGAKPNSEIYKLIYQLRAGFCYEEASNGDGNMSAKLKGWLIKCLDEKRILGNLTDRYNERVNDFDYSNISKKLEAGFRSLIDGNFDK